jgi:hypothetical protein
MSRKLLIPLALLAAVPLFLSGALHRPFAEPALAAAPIFVPRAILLPKELHDASADRLFDLAIERLSPEQVAWLHVIVWQRMVAAEVPFESSGILQTGPGDCVRLDLTIRAGVLAGRCMVVSDGHSLAHLTQLGKAEPTVTSRLLAPAGAAGDAPSPKFPPKELCDLGCGGPHPLLKDLRGKLKELAMQTGTLQGRPQVRIQGRFASVQAAAEPSAAVAADFCYLYLDAQTLWPGRLEWWAASSERRQRPLLEIEFRDPQLNRPLSLPECIRAFSYRPEQG